MTRVSSASRCCRQKPPHLGPARGSSGGVCPRPLSQMPPATYDLPSPTFPVPCITYHFWGGCQTKCRLGIKCRILLSACHSLQKYENDEKVEKVENCAPIPLKWIMLEYTLRGAEGADCGFSPHWIRKVLGAIVVRLTPNCLLPLPQLNGEPGSAFAAAWLGVCR